jgi:hypothetical protein
MLLLERIFCNYVLQLSNDVLEELEVLKFSGLYSLLLKQHPSLGVGYIILNEIPRMMIFSFKQKATGIAEVCIKSRNAKNYI